MNYKYELEPLQFQTVWNALGEQQAKHVFLTMLTLHQQTQAQELAAQQAGLEAALRTRLKPARGRRRVQRLGDTLPPGVVIAE